jgi:hypothetical protein
MSSSLGDTSLGTDEAKSSLDVEKRFEPIDRTGSRTRHSGSTVRRPGSSQSADALGRACSLSDGYSHHAANHDALREPSLEGFPPEAGEEHTVAWDGSEDPEDPRNLSLLRRWLVLMVIVMGSLCVYVSAQLGLRPPIRILPFPWPDS